jgi:hypothetical protein
MPILCPPPRLPTSSPLSRVDVFVGSHWHAVSRTGSGCHSSAACSALGRVADAQKRVPTTKCLHLRGLLTSSQGEIFLPDRIGMRLSGLAETVAPEERFPHWDGRRTRRSASLPKKPTSESLLASPHPRLLNPPRQFASLNALSYTIVVF